MSPVFPTTQLFNKVALITGASGECPNMPVLSFYLSILNLKLQIDRTADQDTTHVIVDFSGGIGAATGKS